MPGEVSRSYDGPRDGCPLFPPWVCQQCGAELVNNKCPQCSKAAQQKAQVDSPVNNHQQAKERQN